MKPKKKLVKNENLINSKMPDNIEEYFSKVEGSKEMFHTKALFKAENEDVGLKTDLNFKEISYINILFFNDELLKKVGLEPQFNDFLNNYMKLKFSLDRKSRGEFVSVNSHDDIKSASDLASNISNITGVKK